MTILDDKEWYKSKTFWAGIFLIGYAIYLVITGQDEQLDKIVEMILGGAGLIGLRQAIGRV